MLDLTDLISIKYPNARIGFGYDVWFADYGNGQEIQGWNLEEEQPSKEEIDSWQDDPEVIAAHQAKLNIIANNEIYAQLDVIDYKSVRPLRENDTARLQELNVQAAALRAQLLPTTLEGVLAGNSSGA